MIDVRELRSAAAEPLRQLVDHIMLDEFEAAFVLKMAEIVGTPRLEIVETDHVRAIGQEPIAQIGTDEARPASH